MNNSFLRIISNLVLVLLLIPIASGVAFWMKGNLAVAAAIISAISIALFLLLRSVRKQKGKKVKYLQVTHHEFYYLLAFTVVVLACMPFLILSLDNGFTWKEKSSKAIQKIESIEDLLLEYKTAVNNEYKKIEVQARKAANNYKWKSGGRTEYLAQLNQIFGEPDEKGNYPNVFSNSNPDSVIAEVEIKLKDVEFMIIKSKALSSNKGYRGDYFQDKMDVLRFNFGSILGVFTSFYYYPDIDKLYDRLLLEVTEQYPDFEHAIKSSKVEVNFGDPFNALFETPILKKLNYVLGVIVTCLLVLLSYFSTSRNSPNRKAPKTHKKYYKEILIGLVIILNLIVIIL